jgi:nitrogen fixation protein FixH
MISQKNKEAMKNPWVIGLLLSFTIFLIGNVTFIYLAFSQAPNLVSSDFYERGERYEQTLRKAQNEKQLNWTGVLMAPYQINRDKLQTYDVVVQGKESQVISPSTVILHAYRPSDASADFQIEFVRQRPGFYQANIAFPLQGSWDVIVEVKQNEQRFLLTKRLTVSP